MQRFSGKTAVVTGAGQGVGKATAARLAGEGATVVLMDRMADLCRQAADEMCQTGAQALAVPADLETHAGAHGAYAQALEQLGRIDIAVHVVGGTIWMKPFWEYQPSEIEREIQRSLWPTLWCCREVIQIMRAQGHGAIVNVGSAVTRGGLYRVPYAAAKAGVHTMTLCLANELADSGIRVNCVAPGALDNADRVVARNSAPLTEAEQVWYRQMYARSLETTPMKRRGRAEEIVSAICFLASDEASYVTGQTLSVAGGALA